jgi:hypothetical protein
MIFTHLLRLTPHAHLNFPFERWALSHYCSQGFLTLMSWISWSDKRKWYMLSCLPNNTCYILPLNPYPAIPMSVEGRRWMQCWVMNNCMALQFSWSYGPKFDWVTCFNSHVAHTFWRASNWCTYQSTDLHWC